MTDLRVIPTAPDDSADGAADTGKRPAPLLRYYGSELRRFREAAGLTQEELGKRINCSKSKVSMVETGRSSPLEATKKDRLNSPFTRQCEEALNTGGALTRILPLLVDVEKAYPDWFRPFPGLESEATEIYSFEPQAVPGLLQTEDYARELLRSYYPPISDAELESQVQARMHRQEALKRKMPPLSWFLLDEAVLRRPVGGAELFAAQLDHLLITGGNRWVQLQIIPFTRGPHALMNGSMVILQLPKDRVLYVEGQGSAHITATEPDVYKATLTFHAACAQALSTEESLQLIAEIRGTLC
ncbi:Scr1 family TA system antitoxin-like transcriptional regulator [Nocardiopsis flavescens]|uniref:Helix-turn-helix domain-containing protein n=1 Tax=Nocardiopsis flavescens TaxID=758803 RepID=A0A1M6QFU6_9ACTN|nr:helix-turn-helix transcriptional regulator [Nocardiopsis flavescens]SHK19122.1 Helix-turn-helix domain-containing protein [Nocardiopsis flavescens]